MASVILDVGCATGGLASSMATYLDVASGGMAIGLDAAPEMVNVARSKRASATCRFDIGVAENLPYSDNCFDKAASSFFFHQHLADAQAAFIVTIIQWIKCYKYEGTPATAAVWSRVLGEYNTFIFLVKSKIFPYSISSYRFCY